MLQEEDERTGKEGKCVFAIQSFLPCCSRISAASYSPQLSVKTPKIPRQSSSDLPGDSIYSKHKRKKRH